MKAPIVQKRMTRLPLEIEQINNVANARRLMGLFGIRHVPVMGGLHLKGVVSDRDIMSRLSPRAKKLMSCRLKTFASMTF